jgi:hypothetical protein
LAIWARCRLPIPGAVPRADWHKLFDRSALLAPEKLRERASDLELIGKHTREALKQQTEFSAELKALVREANKDAECPEDQLFETEGQAQARESAAADDRAAHESDEAGAAEADARANEGFSDGEPPPMEDETFEKMGLETPLILKKRLIKSLLEEIGLAAAAHGKPVPINAKHFIETLFELNLANVEFARRVIDLILEAEKDAPQQKDVAQLTDLSGNEMEIIEDKDHAYAQRISDTEE